MTEQIGFERFLEWVESNFINHSRIYRSGRRNFSLETKDYVVSLFDTGLPISVISRTTDLSLPNIRRWVKEHGRTENENTQNKRNITISWYENYLGQYELNENDRSQITLENYIDSYGNTIWNNYNEIINSLFKLDSINYNFPFVPRSSHAYLAGNNIGDGWIGGNEYKLGFMGSREEMERMNEEFNLDGHIARLNEAGEEYDFPGGRKIRKNDVYILNCSTALGRLYHLLGIPKGIKTHQSFLIPDWIMENETEYGNEFLAGLFDTNGNIFPRGSAGNSDISITIFKIPELEENLREFMEQIASIFESNQINLVKRGIKIYRRKDMLIGRIGISLDRPNLERFISATPIRYNSRIERLETIASLPSRYKKEEVFEYIKENGFVTTKDISSKFKINTGTANWHLLNLFSEGMIERENKKGKGGCFLYYVPIDKNN